MGTFDDLNEDLMADEDHTLDVIRCDVPGMPSFRAAFIKDHKVESSSDDYTVSITETTISCLEHDVYGVSPGEKLLIDGKSYEVVVPRPDGTGWSTLIIEAIE